MPTAWNVLYLGIDPRHTHLHHLHAALSEILEHGLVGHIGQHVKPYTISPLWEHDLGAVQQLTWLSDSSTGTIDDRMRQSFGQEIRFGTQTGVISTIERLETTSFESLIEPGVAPFEFKFTFHSPVTFRKGNRTEPSPYPTAVFGHLRRRWHEFCDPGTELTIDFADCEMLIGSINGFTHVVDIPKRGAIKGFVGDVTIECAPTTKRSARQALHALARFAAFAGVGANTTIGFGLTDYEPSLGSGR